MLNVELGVTEIPWVSTCGRLECDRLVRLGFPSVGIEEVAAWIATLAVFPVGCHGPKADKGLFAARSV